MSDAARRLIDDLMKAVMTGANPDDADAIICMPVDEAEGFEDDKFDDCMLCGTKVRFRPYMPKLPHVCIDCAGFRL